MATPLTECAWAAAAKKNCFLKDKFWRITTQSGGNNAPAVVAIAHSWLILTYQVLRTGQLYQDQQVPVLEQRQKQRLNQHHLRRLGKLGVAVYGSSSGASSTAAPPTSSN